MKTKFDEFVFKRTYTDENGNPVSEDVLYKTFISYDANVFVQTFYDIWFPNGKDGAPAFRPSNSTMQLLDFMQEFAKVDADFYAVKRNRLGIYCAIGDKMLFKATKFAEKAIASVLENVQAQKQFASMMFGNANSKKEQDYAIDFMLDKIAEVEALKKCITASSTAKIFFRKEDRKEIMQYFRQNNRQTINFQEVIEENDLQQQEDILATFKARKEQAETKEMQTNKQSNVK